MIKNITPPPQDLLLITLCPYLFNTFDTLVSDYQGHNKSLGSNSLFKQSSVYHCRVTWLWGAGYGLWEEG